jgi:hypothetical protein
MREHVIRALHSERTVRVYQAYRPEIAEAALAAGRFVPPFSEGRMTWIKPSFNWMMYRSGYGTKPGQEVVLAIDITREGFAWALDHAALSRFIPTLHASHEDWRKQLAESPVRVQWDPERDWRLEPVKDVRAIQIGLSGEAVVRYVHEWTVRIENVTALAHRIAADRDRGTTPDVMPDRLEIAYPASAAVRHRICRE